MTAVVHPSVDERSAQGKAAREQLPPSVHTGWTPASDRPDPVALLEEQNATREPDLVPVRHGRMLVSPFTFYRGAAKIMATDLKDTPTAGLNVQLCGDAHLSNFGAFASPERTLLFDLNDFDETLPGPFEYDVKRMAASFTIAARNNSFNQSDSVAATCASVTAYRNADGGVRRDAHDGRLVRAPGRTRAHERDQGRHPRHGTGGQQEGRQDRGEDRREAGTERRTRATACRRCRSWPSSSMAATGSSASLRS